MFPRMLLYGFHIGFKEQDIAAGGKSVWNVTFIEDVHDDEVVGRRLRCSEEKQRHRRYCIG